MQRSLLMMMKKQKREEKANMIPCPGGKAVRRFLQGRSRIPAFRGGCGESLYEAVAIAARNFANAGCPPTSGSEMDIEVKAPAVTHKITLNRVSAWVNGVAKSPKDKVLKDRLKELLSALPTR